MQIDKTYSFKGGEAFLKRHHPAELNEVIKIVEQLNAVSFLTKESKEKTKVGKVLISPTDMNDAIKHILHEKNWTEKSKGVKKKIYAEPRHSFGKGHFREMDGIKNKVGIEVQFGKYAFMGYDIFGKMIIFKNLNYIECGIEIVPSAALVRFMSTGVSSFDQVMIDFKYRGESDIDIPVYVIGIGMTEQEHAKVLEWQKLFKENRPKFLESFKLRAYSGSAPGPKSK